MNRNVILAKGIILDIYTCWDEKNSVLFRSNFLSRGATGRIFDDIFSLFSRDSRWIGTSFLAKDNILEINTCWDEKTQFYFDQIFGPGVLPVGFSMIFLACLAVILDESERHFLPKVIF